MYSDQETQQLLELYKYKTTKEIADELQKSERSVIAKLVREGVYQKLPRYTKKTGLTKKEILSELENLVGFEVEGLAPAKKETLNNILDFIKVGLFDELPG